MTYENFEIPARDQIEDCEELDTLLYWHTECLDIIDNVRSQLDSRKLAGIADKDWLHKAADKLSIALAASRRIERHFAALAPALCIR